MLNALDQLKDIGAASTAASDIVAQYLQQLRSITIIRMLVPLFVASQQHRGANLALLEGNHLFNNKVAMLQNEINNRLLTLDMLNEEFTETIYDTELQQLQQEWEAVRDWVGGSALESFKFHSHFIEQQMKLIWSVTERANYFSSLAQLPAAQQANNVEDTKQSLVGDDLLIQFVLREIPELIELIAKIRGLATHVSVLAYCDEEHYSWIEYLLKMLNQKKELFRKLSKSLQTYVFGGVPAIIDLTIQDASIVQFVNIIDQKILSRENIDVNSQEVFDMASDIIDSHAIVINQGLTFIRNKMNNLLDDWHTDHIIQSIPV